MRMVATHCLALAAALTGCADDPEPMSELERHIFEQAIVFESDPTHILGGEVLAAEDGRYELAFSGGFWGRSGARAYFYQPSTEVINTFRQTLEQADPIQSGFDVDTLQSPIVYVSFSGYDCDPEIAPCAGPSQITLLIPTAPFAGAQNENAWRFDFDEFDIAAALEYDLDDVCSGEFETHEYSWMEGWFDCFSKVQDTLSNDPRLDPETRLPVSIAEFDNLLSSLSRMNSWTMHYESPWEDEIERRVGIMMGNYRDPVPAFSGVREHIFAEPPPREDDEASRAEADRMEAEADRLEADAMED